MIRKLFLVGCVWRVLKILELVYIDVCDFMRILFFDNSRYFILFIDDYFWMIRVYFMKDWFEVFKIFSKFKNYIYVEKESVCFIKKFRSDNGKEYIFFEFNKFCDEEGIYY